MSGAQNTEVSPGGNVFSWDNLLGQLSKTVDTVFGGAMKYLDFEDRRDGPDGGGSVGFTGGGIGGGVPPLPTADGGGGGGMPPWLPYVAIGGAAILLLVLRK